MMNYVLSNKTAVVSRSSAKASGDELWRTRLLIRRAKQMSGRRRDGWCRQSIYK